MKLTSQMLSLTFLMPTLWPAKTSLRLIFCLLKQMRPHVVTVPRQQSKWQAVESD